MALHSLPFGCCNLWHPTAMQERACEETMTAVVFTKVWTLVYMHVSRTINIVGHV